MSVAKKSFRVVLVALFVAILAITYPSSRANAATASGFMKKNNIRTALKENKEATVQSYCYGLGLRDSKVRILSLEKEDAPEVPGYEVAYLQIQVSTPKLSAKKIKKALAASKEAGLGKTISPGYYGIIMDGNTGKNLSVVALSRDEVDGVFSVMTMEYDGHYTQKAAGYDIEGYRDLIYSFAIAYPKNKRNIYVGIAGEKKPDRFTRAEFESGNRRFNKTNMFSKKNSKLSVFCKIN